MARKRYLTYFERHSQYVAFVNSPDYNEPNTSVCHEEGEVHYNGDTSVTLVDEEI